MGEEEGQVDIVEQLGVDGVGRTEYSYFGKTRIRSFLGVSHGSYIWYQQNLFSNLQMSLSKVLSTPLGQ